jgi:tetratricopeptide (TPR) repeat protein
MKLLPRRIHTLLFAIAVGACCAAAAQAPSDYTLQLQQGSAQLQAGNAEAALAAGDAAVRMEPDRWDGYELAGRALLRLQRYEAAADALSRAIERAPAAQQGPLRDLRRQALLAESGVAPAGRPAGAAAATAAASAPVPVPAPASVPAPVPAVAAPSAVAPATVARVQEQPRSERRRARPVVPGGPLDSSVWLDGSTGLMWARPWAYPLSATGPWDFNGAQAFCSNLQILGYADWRLPTLQEAQSVYLASAKRWRWSVPKFAPGYGLDDALSQGVWRPAAFTVGGDTFNGNRILLWTSTPGDQAGEHVGLYFGKRYNARDDQKIGIALAGERRRNPYQGYALCVRSGQTQAQAAAAP